MSKKNQKDDKNLIQEVNLDELDIISWNNKNESEESIYEDLLEDEEDDLLEDEEDFDEFEVKDKKEKWLNKIPIDRSEDKRRLWKWLQKFIDTEVPKEILDWMPEEIQELMKKGKRDWKITQDEIMAALPHAEDDIDLLDEIYTRFLQIKIEIVDNLDKDNLFTSDKKQVEEDI